MLHIDRIKIYQKAKDLMQQPSYKRLTKLECKIIDENKHEFYLWLDSMLEKDEADSNVYLALGRKKYKNYN